MVEARLDCPFEAVDLARYDELSELEATLIRAVQDNGELTG